MHGVPRGLVSVWVREVLRLCCSGIAFWNFVSPQAPRVSCRPPIFAIVLEQENGYRMSTSIGIQNKELGRPEPETGDFLFRRGALYLSEYFFS